MGLKSLINSSIETAFTILGASDADGLQQAITYNRITSGAYNPVTGVTTDTTASTVFDAILYAARDREIDGIKILVDDLRLVFPFSRISFIPSHNDTVSVGGQTYNIVNQFTDSSESIYTLFIRST